jgi:hypothetical protein
MVPFLESILPYLREKKPQAELMLEFFRDAPPRGVRASESLTARRHEIVTTMKELKLT